MKLGHRKISTFKEAILPCRGGWFYVESTTETTQSLKKGKTIQNYNNEIRNML